MKTRINTVLMLALALMLIGATSMLATQAGPGPNVPPPRPKGPCDIYAAAADPCVAAHSTTRALYASYNGPLYQSSGIPVVFAFSVAHGQPAEASVAFEVASIKPSDRARLMSAAVWALSQVMLLGGVPLFGYWMWQRRRYKRTFGDTARRAGLQLGRPRYLVYSLLFSAAGVAALVTWPPPLEPLVRQGSMYRPFAGLGLSGQAIAMSLLFGAVQTGFTEELLFRGLIAGSLSRRLPFVWANLAQALLFLLPHLGGLFMAPEMWPMMTVVPAVALVFGWVRIKSGSILGGWLIHASSNVTMALVIAART